MSTLTASPHFSVTLYALVRALVLNALRLALRLERIEGLNALEHAQVICPNHPSYFDFFVVSAASRRRVRFVLYYKYFRLPVLRSIFARCGVIPIASRSECPDTYRAAFDAMRRALKAGEPVCLFPEGKVSARELGPIRGGVVKLARASGASVTPMRISYRGAPRFGRRRVRAAVGDAIPSAEVTTERLGEALKA